MSETWRDEPERGSRALMRLIVWIAFNLGYPVGRFLLYPICLYFVLFAGGALKASREYLGRVLGRKPGILDCFRHFHCFASTILDRPYFLTGRFNRFDIRFHGLEQIEKIAEEGRGCLLLGAHFGSFEVLRCLAGQREDLVVRAMMFPDNATRIGSVLDGLNPDISDSVIPLGRPDSIMRAHESLSRGEVVGILADRNVGGTKRIAVPFLGEEADFPTGPMILAATVGCPVMLFHGIYRGRRSYDIYFEMLCDRPPVDHRRDPEGIARLVRSYVSRLEENCHQAPMNWFNFFAFWNKNAV